MNDERRGGASAGDDLEERLAGRFAVELERAERDYPELSESRHLPSAARGPAGSRWPRLGWAAVAVGALAMVGLIGVGLAFRPGMQVAGPSGAPRGAEGIPTQIDGQKVHWIAAQADWENLTGSFLLGAYAINLPLPCPSPMAPLASANADLAGQCGGIGLTLFSGGIDPAALGLGTVVFHSVAPRGSDLLTGWLDGPAVVMRVHTHDSGAARCSADVRAACEAAIVVEAVVWPEVPAQLSGERVYRAVDQASFPATGSFLLGGRVTKPDAIPPCPAPINKTQAEQQLIPYCYWSAIDGLEVAPIGSVDEPKNEIVVARVHISDPLAAQCPTELSAQCRQAIVVESIAWRSDVLLFSATPTPSPAPSMPGQNPVGTGEGIGPIGSQSVGTVTPPSAGSLATLSSTVLGPDGIPIKYNGDTVYRATDLGAATSFFFGGLLGRDAACAPPTTPLITPPACGYWTIDGLAVGTTVQIPESAIGSPIVVRVDRLPALGTCTGGPCRTTDLLVVSEVLWYGPPAPLLPPAP